MQSPFALGMVTTLPSSHALMQSEVVPTSIPIEICFGCAMTSSKLQNYAQNVVSFFGVSKTMTKIVHLYTLRQYILYVTKYATRERLGANNEYIAMFVHVGGNSVGFGADSVFVTQMRYLGRAR